MFNYFRTTRIQFSRRRATCSILVHDTFRPRIFKFGQNGYSFLRRGNTEQRRKERQVLSVWWASLSSCGYCLSKVIRHLDRRNLWGILMTSILKMWLKRDKKTENNPDIKSQDMEADFSQIVLKEIGNRG